MTETERTIERGTVRVRRGPKGCLAASVQDVPLWVGYLHPQTVRDLLTATAAALEDEVVMFDAKQIHDYTFQVMLMAQQIERDRANRRLDHYLSDLDWYIKRLQEIALHDVGLGPKPEPDTPPSDRLAAAPADTEPRP